MLNVPFALADDGVGKKNANSYTRVLMLIAFLMKLSQVMEGVPEYVNRQRIPTRIGVNRLELSKRSLSDILEKWVMDFLLVNHGDLVEYRAGSAYDFRVILDTEEFLVNIKTEQGQSKYSWLCSSSVIIKRKDILHKLFFYKLTYEQTGDVIRIVDAGIAGPIDKLMAMGRVITYQKGDPLPKGVQKGEMATHYNGKHCFLSRESFKSLA